MRLIVADLNWNATTNKIEGDIATLWGVFDGHGKANMLNNGRPLGQTFSSASTVFNLLAQPVFN